MNQHVLFFFCQRGNHAAEMVVITTVTMSTTTHKYRKTKDNQFQLSEGLHTDRYNSQLDRHRL